MRTIYKSLSLAAMTLQVSLALGAQTYDGETTSEMALPADVLESLRVELITPNVSGARNLIASGECVIDGSNLTITLDTSEWTRGATYRVQVVATFGTQTQVIYALDVTVPYYVALSDTPQEYEDDVTVVSTIGDGTGEDDLKKAISLTYAQLKAKRDTGELIPGQYYRITDYVTMVAGYDNARSAGHAFDVIVLALSTDTLSEEAHAIQHAGDTYFADCNLAAWQIWYDINNDTTKYNWADATNGKGVIWRMIDEHNNDCPYDFKNIQFKRWAITDISSTSLTADALSSLKEALVYADNGNRHMANKDIYGNWIPQDVQGTEYTIDEDNSGWYYTFDGISSEDGETPGDHYDMSAHPFRLSPECIQAQLDDDCGTDYADYCKNNIIKSAYHEYVVDDQYYKGRQVLNNIVFANSMSYCYYDEEGESWNYTTNYCYANVFESECTYNTFGNSCYNNTLGNKCNNNTFGNYFQNNTFGNNCYGNTFGNDCQYNTFGNYCYNNTFGNNCWYNTFGNYCYNNTFGNNCWNNTFGNDCYYNTFGNDCYNNTFGNSCGANTFGNNCNNNTFGNYFRYNTFGNGLYSNTFGNYFQNNTFGNYCNNNTFGNDYMQCCSFGDGVQYCSISNYSTGSSNYLQYIIVLNGTQGSDSNNLLALSDLSVGVSYSQTCGLNSSGTYTHKNVLD